jgi:hypothetical protein
MRLAPHQADAARRRSNASAAPAAALADASSAVVQADAISAAALTDWYRQLGTRHRRRDALAQLSARAIEDRDQSRQAACRHRWPPIVAAMRTLIDGYNEGAGGPVLTLVERATHAGGEPTATVTARSGRTLVLAVDDSDLWVRARRDANGTTESERWIGLNRTDAATAAYVLQNWVAQLDTDETILRAEPQGRRGSVAKTTATRTSARRNGR